MRCPHQNGLLYMVPAERSWVCSDEHRHAHVLAGFFKELSGLDDPRVRAAMNRWGLYYRERPLDEEPGGGTGDGTRNGGGGQPR
jgi:hypothetical protein